MLLASQSVEPRARATRRFAFKFPSLDAAFADIVAYVTSFMTLKAGDIICTGTPIKKGPKADPPIWLKPGDTIEVECPDIGVLRNSVVDEK